jgi:hypothetical protein
MPDYAICGLTLRVNCSLPDAWLPTITDGLLASKALATQVDLCLGKMPDGFDTACRVAMKTAPWYVSQDQGAGGQPSLVIHHLEQESGQGSHFWLRYSDGTDFLVNDQGTKVWAVWPEQFAVDYVLTYVLGVILGIVLHLQGVVCLHGSAIAIQDQAILLLGDSGAGKSTTAAALSQRGFAILSDDIVPLHEHQGRLWVQPTYPQIRLWSDTVTALYGAPNRLPQLTDSWEKRCLDHRHQGYQFQSHPLPLGAIYLLRERSTDASVPEIAAVSRTQGLLDLIFNRYTNNLPDKVMQAHCFEVLSQVVRQVPIRQITPLDNLDTLPQLCDLLIADFQTGG